MMVYERGSLRNRPGGRVLVEFVKVTQNLACVCLNDSVVSTWTLDS